MLTAPFKGSLDASEKIVALFGDSMTFQHHRTGPKILEAAGYFAQVQAVTGNRYIFDNSLNFGVSGERTTDGAARVATVAASPAQVVITLFGANDRRLFLTAAQSIAAYQTIINALRSAGKKMIFITGLPMRDSIYTGLGFTAAQIAQAKADILTVNAWLFSQEASDLYVADAYTRWVDEDGQARVGLTFDDLHPNPLGGFEIMVPVERILTSLYGIRTFTLSPNNKLVNTNFSGTGTAPASRETGQIADNHITAGSAPASSPASRTYSKDLGQVMQFNFPTSGGSTRDNMRLSQRSTADYSTKTAYYECELRVLDPGPLPGIWHAMSVELLASGTSLSIGFDRGDVTDPLPMHKLLGFMAARKRTILLRTPVAVVPTSAYVEGRLNIEANSTVGAKTGKIELLHEQLVVT